MRPGCPLQRLRPCRARLASWSMHAGPCLGVCAPAGQRLTRHSAGVSAPLALRVVQEYMSEDLLTGVVEALHTVVDAQPDTVLQVRANSTTYSGGVRAMQCDLSTTVPPC